MQYANRPEIQFPFLYEDEPPRRPSAAASTCMLIAFSNRLVQDCTTRGAVASQQLQIKNYLVLLSLSLTQLYLITMNTYVTVGD